MTTSYKPPFIGGKWNVPPKSVAPGKFNLGALSAISCKNFRLLEEAKFEFAPLHVLFGTKLFLVNVRKDQITRSRRLCCMLSKHSSFATTSRSATASYNWRLYARTIRLVQLLECRFLVY